MSQHNNFIILCVTGVEKNDDGTYMEEDVVLQELISSCPHTVKQINVTSVEQLPIFSLVKKVVEQTREFPIIDSIEHWFAQFEYPISLLMQDMLLGLQTKLSNLIRSGAKNDDTNYTIIHIKADSLKDSILKYNNVMFIDDIEKDIEDVFDTLLTYDNFEETLFNFIKDTANRAEGSYIVVTPILHNNLKQVKLKQLEHKGWILGIPSQRDKLKDKNLISLLEESLKKDVEKEQTSCSCKKEDAKEQDSVSTDQISEVEIPQS